MGVVKSQTIKNVFSTYFGFAIGAVNTLFLYTFFLSDVYYGLVAFMLSTSNIMMPLMTFGANHTIIKFYSSFKTRQSVDAFLTWMLFLPFLTIIPIGLIGYFSFEWLIKILGNENPIVGDYFLHIYLIAIAMAYFEVFFSWSKVHLKTVFGNFMKEVFHRVAVMILLFCVHFEYLNTPQFINALGVVYVVRTAVMKWMAFSVRFPKLRFKSLSNSSDILKYAALIIIAGSVSTLLLDIDKFMLNSYIPIQEVAYYSVAVFIAAVIAVPQRSMHQILAPLNAQFLNSGMLNDLKNLYIKSSITLFTVSGLLFLLIVLNINQLYALIPSQFSNGLYVVFLISLTKLFDSLLGSNNAILFNSKYYRVVVFLGIFLALLTVVLNLLFIPKFGIDGAAIATFLAISVYNMFKLWFVYVKFKIQPVTEKTILIFVLIVLSILILYFWEFSFHPVINIVLKSVLTSIWYIVVILKLNISEDITLFFKKVWYN
jgi:O-antigen/teichoic acid export membrane protein